MHTALIGSDHVLAVLSQTYLESGFATSEWAAAMGDDPIGMKRRLIPVRVQNVRPSGLLHNRVYIDLVGLSEDEATEKLLTGVGEQRAKPQGVPFPGRVSPFQSPPPFPGAAVSTVAGSSRNVLTEAEVLARAVAALPQFQSGSSGMLHVALATDANQRLLRPSEFDGDELSRSLQQLALFGAPILEVKEGVQVKRDDKGRLVLEQRDARVTVDERGTVVVTLPAVRRSQTTRLLPCLIEEDVAQDIERSLDFASRALELLDAASTVQVVAVAAAITGGHYLGWRTRREQQANPNSMSMNMSAPDLAVAELDRVRPKADLPSRVREIVLDLTALLRRSLRGH